MNTDNLVPLEQHNQLTAGPAPWTEVRVPAQVFHVCRAVFGTTNQEDDQRVYRTLQAALMVQQQPAAPAVTSDMVGRFLSWKLPEDFGPDCFIRFDKAGAKENNSWPVGTNLLHAGQVRDMLQHVLGG